MQKNRGSFRMKRNCRSLRLESLENRCLLAVCAGIESLAAVKQAVEIEDQPILMTSDLPQQAILGEASEESALVSTLPSYDITNLNSCPTSEYSIYLDFDGHITSGTLWNTSYAEGDIVTPRFTLDGDTSKTEFTSEEKTAIYNIWLRVSEDYLPFNVNITTVEPDAADFTAGKAFRVCIGGSYNDWLGEGAGGISFVGSFTWESDTPNFVFSESLYYNVKYISEVITHEVGHAVGLSHDGNRNVSGQEEYYQGANGWAPIMGAAYYQALTQWSCGEYDGATNKEDDLQIISTRNGFGYRDDDYGDDFASAETLTITDGEGAISGIIERNTDVDYFSFVSDGSSLKFWIGGQENITNLDVLVSVYDANQTLLTTYNPTNTLSVSFTFTEAAGTYYLTVEGTGKETATSGIYSDYGSLGAYNIIIGSLPLIVVTTTDDTVNTDEFISLREAVILAQSGGVIRFDPSLAGETITLANGALTLSQTITIDASDAPGLIIQGGGNSRIFNITGAVELIGLTLTGGNAGTKGMGGAISISSKGSVALVNSLLYGNSAGTGGAVYNFGTLCLYNVTITDNQAVSNKAGGIFNCNSGTVESYNSIIAENTAEISDPDIYNLSGTITGSNNLSSFIGWNSGDNNLVYSSSMALFTDASSGNYQLCKDSAAIDVGNNDFVDTSVDLAGKARIENGKVDLGAYEYHSSVEKSPVDLNGDGKINLSDLALFSPAWLSKEGSENWNPVCDINKDGSVGFLDYYYLSVNWLKKTTDPGFINPPSSSELPGADEVLANEEDWGENAADVNFTPFAGSQSDEISTDVSRSAWTELEDEFLTDVKYLL